MDSRGSDFLESNFDRLGGAFWHHLTEGVLDERNERSQKLAAIFAVFLVLYGGVEFVKLLFRSRFGLEAIDLRKVAAVVIGMLIVSGMCFAQYSTESTGLSAGYDTQVSFLIGGIMYLGLSIYTLVKYVTERKRSKTFFALHRVYRGDSTVLNFLIASGWNPSSVQNLAEPLLLISIGVFLLQWNLFLGGPLILFGLSYWLHLLVETVMGNKTLRDFLSNEGYRHSQESTFVEVVN